MAGSVASITRNAFSPAKILGYIGEAIGLLNKGSVKASGAAGGNASGKSISANSLNVTRVGGVGAVISGAGGAALLLFKVNKSTDPPSIVVAAYLSVGVIVAAALVTVAMIIVADVRTRGSVAASAAVATPEPAEQVKYIRAIAAANSEDMDASLDRAYEYVIVNAAAAGVKLLLPSAAASPWQPMRIMRDDDAEARNVALLAQNTDQVLGERRHDLPAGNSLLLYSNGQSWLEISR